MNKFLKNKSLWLFFVGLLLIVPVVSFAQVWTGPAGEVTCNLAGSDPCDFCDMIIVAANVYWLIVQIIMVLGTVFIIAGAIIMLSGAFSANWHAMGKSAITWAIIGITVAILSWVIINTIFYFLADEEYRGWGVVDCTMLDFLTAVPSRTIPPITPPDDPDDPDEDDPDEDEEEPEDGPIRSGCVGVSIDEGCLYIASGATSQSMTALGLEQDPTGAPVEGVLILWNGGPDGAEAGSRETTFALITENEITVRLSAPSEFEGGEFLGWSNRSGNCEFVNPSGPRNQLTIDCTYSNEVIGVTAWYRQTETPSEALTLQELAQYFLDNKMCDDVGMSCGTGPEEDDLVGPCDNLTETVNGDPLTVCETVQKEVSNNGNGTMAEFSCDEQGGNYCEPNPDVTLDVRLLQALYEFSQEPGIFFIITSLTTGPHVLNSRHYDGRAADISAVSGTSLSAAAQFFENRGFSTIVYTNHVHIEI